MASFPEKVAVVYLCASLVACILIFLFVVLATPSRREPLRISVIVHAIAAVLWSGHHSSDRDPWQWPSLLIDASAMLMALAYFVAVHFAGLEEKDRNSRTRMDSLHKLRRSDQNEA